MLCLHFSVALFIASVSSIIKIVLGMTTDRVRRLLCSQPRVSQRRLCARGRWKRPRPGCVTRPEFRSRLPPSHLTARAFEQVTTAGSAFPSLMGENAKPALAVMGTRLTGVRNKTGKRRWSCEEGPATIIWQRFLKLSTLLKCCKCPKWPPLSPTSARQRPVI